MKFNLIEHYITPLTSNWKAHSNSDTQIQVIMNSANGIEVVLSYFTAESEC